MRPLATHPCQGRCAWASTNEYHDGQRVFRCAGCTSEWVSSEPWTPIDADGTLAREVTAERSRGRS
jgi:hypothetical protein